MSLVGTIPESVRANWPKLGFLGFLPLKLPVSHFGEREKRLGLGAKADSKALAVLRAWVVGEGGGFTKVGPRSW